MKGARGLVHRYRTLKAGGLAAATKEFDREMVVSDSRPLRPAEKEAWEMAKRKPGRPRKGAGVKVISVSIERGLLSRTDLLARSMGVSRASLIERGLITVLGAGGGRR
jgi:hypothetical protein